MTEPRAQTPADDGDAVARVIASWARTRPDLDVRPIGVLTRLDRLKRAVDDRMVFSRFGLNGADFAVLATLVRVGGDSGLSQRRLMRELALSSGTVSVRVERLVKAGLVHRGPDPHDGRGSVVTLTEAGRQRFEQVAPVHLDAARRLLSVLTDDEHDQLAALLGKLLASMESDGG